MVMDGKLWKRAIFEFPATAQIGLIGTEGVLRIWEFSEFFLIFC
jgi:hypothetical protein